MSLFLQLFSAFPPVDESHRYLEREQKDTRLLGIVQARRYRGKNELSTTFPFLPSISRSNARLYSIERNRKLVISAQVKVDTPFDLIREQKAAVGHGPTRWAMVWIYSTSAALWKLLSRGLYRSVCTEWLLPQSNWGMLLILVLEKEYTIGQQTHDLFCLLITSLCSWTQIYRPGPPTSFRHMDSVPCMPMEAAPVHA